jgi:hypothetical protein
MAITTTRRGRSQAAQYLLGRRMLTCFALVLAYGGGLWMYLVHEAEGGVEIGAPPGVLHWLRDASLALPLILVAIFLGGTLARRLLDRFSPRASELMAGGVVAVVLAMYASIVLAIGNPIHGLLFPSVHGGGHDLPFALHLVRDGLLALAANELLALALVVVVIGSRWLSTRRGMPLAATRAV